MKKISFPLLTILILFILTSCDNDKEDWKEPPAPPEKLNVLTKITDPVFKNRILYNMDSYDTDKDGKLSEEEAASINDLFLNGAFHVIKGEIKSLDGIEYFTGLLSLDCAHNKLTSLNLSHNLKIDMLSCGFNELTSLNIKKNDKLQQVLCSDNQLEVIDIQDKVQLKKLDCRNNRIKALDLRKSSKLEEVYCQDNQLTELHLGEQKNLAKLYCGNNKLKEIDTGDCEVLRELSLADNQVEVLDISKLSNIRLRLFNAGNNPYMKKLWVWPSFRNYDEYTIPDNVTISIKYHLPDDKDIIKSMLGNMRKYFDEAILNELAEYDTDEYKGALSASEAAQIPVLNLAGKNITRLYNTEYFTGLKEFDFSNNKIKILISFTNNTKLEVLKCSDNSIPDLDLSECQVLHSLNCNNNRLGTLDLSQNSALTFLSCEQNELTVLDISSNKDLQELYCTKNPQLKTLYVWEGFDENQLIHFGIDAGVEIIEKGK